MERMGIGLNKTYLVLVRVMIYNKWWVLVMVLIIYGVRVIFGSIP